MRVAALLLVCAFVGCTRVPSSPSPDRASDRTSQPEASEMSGVPQADIAQPSEAERRALMERVSRDLTGVGPTPSEMDEFLKDQSPEAYERLIDRLLASPRYGELHGRAMLDAARNGSTKRNAIDEYIHRFNEDRQAGVGRPATSRRDQ